MKPVHWAGVALCVAAVGALFVIPQEWVRTYGSVALIVACIASDAFVIGYALLSRWWLTEEGTHLLVFSAAIGAILSWLLAIRVTGISQTAAMYGVTVIYVVMAVLMLWRASIFARRQLTERRKPKERNASA